MKERLSDFLVYNEGWVRWEYPKGELVIFSDYTDKSQSKLISEREDLEVGDTIVWVKDLPKDILAEYQKQIEEL
jgi:hypothetical protein